MADVCTWTEDENGPWETSCGEAFDFVECGPLENGMRFCCYCGKPLAEKPYFEEMDDEEANDATT